MRVALRELRRRPGRFGAATAILTLIAILLMFLGGLLDGLTAGNTGALRAQQADLIVYSATSQDSLVRSRIDPKVRAQVAKTPGVERAGGLGSVQLGARIAGKGPRDLVPVVLFGYDRAPRDLPATPPGRGEVVADDELRAEGVAAGDTIRLGPARTPVRVVGFVTDTQFNGQATVWGSLDTWREALNANRPAGGVAPGVVQALAVDVDGEGEPSEVASAIDGATNGATSSLTTTEAINAIPGVSAQRSTFNQIIGVTIVIAIVVVALFFALITIERMPLYGVLKAIGARSRTLFGGVLLQAVVVTLVACAIGAAAAVALDAVIPPGAIPFVATPARLLSSVAFLLLAAVIGCVFSLRRVLRVDPATAIGGAP
jgi:putative ABC transport system permease protein